MNRTLLKQIALTTLALLTLLIIGGLWWLVRLDSEIQARIVGGWFAPPVEFYTRGYNMTLGQQQSMDQLVQQLKGEGYGEVDPSRRLQPKQYVRLSALKCRDHLGLTFDGEVDECLQLKTESKNSQYHNSYTVGFFQHEISHILSHESGEFLNELRLSPRLFAQFFGEKAVLRRTIEIGQVPLSCLQGVTAIEDSRFLEHSGVSPSSIARAMWRNFRKGYWAEGGSTITQQLTKNYFLTSEKTLRRKIKEALMSIVIEYRFDKDQILGSYLNEIYMGQNGPFEVRGFGAAARHYFYKDIEELNLAECSLLAALLNSPGRYNPFKNPDNAGSRRNLVLEQMYKYDMITEEDLNLAKKAPLPVRRPSAKVDPAPYYVQAVQKQMRKLGIDLDQGLKVYTSIDIQSQMNAQETIKNGLEEIENHWKRLKENHDRGHQLQGSLISIDISSGDVVAMVGGRSYRQTQYNRALEARRQVGSIMKPFVFLAALETLDETGENFNPLTPLYDTPLDYKYEGQSWSPKNYDEKFRGKVPMFYALAKSINVPTAKLGIQIGLDSVIGVARRLGINSEIKALPSLTLGSYELYPWEVARAYMSIARMGQIQSIHYIRSIETFDGKVLFSVADNKEQVLAPDIAASLIGMMKQTTQIGTARSLKAFGLPFPVAGKTGTTSDFKDSWFVGFTPDRLTLVWVGYDDNQPHGLTGATGALPLWIKFTQREKDRLLQSDFEWPAGTHLERLSTSELEQEYPGAEFSKDEIELIFPAGS